MNGWSVTGRILLAAMQSILIIAGSWYAVFVYYAEIHPNRQVEKNFKKTQCHILKSSLQTKKVFFDHVTLYRANFVVKYQALGPIWQSETSGIGIGQHFSTDKRTEEALIRRMPVGTVHPCWFNPVVPHNVVLLPRHRFFSSFHFFIPLVIVALMTYGLIRNLLAGAQSLRKSRMILKNKK